MPKKTTNYNLIKPEQDEFYDVAVPNANMDKIDGALKTLQDAINTGVNEQEIEVLRGELAAHLADGVKHVTAAERTAWNTKAGTTTATTTANGLMSSADKTKLDGIATGANDYTHPATHPPSIIAQDASNRFVTDTEKNNWNAKETTAGAQGKANTAEANAKSYTDSKLATIKPSIIDDDPNDITYYVRTTGNDNNDGKTVGTAFKTFAKALTMWKTITTGGKRTFDVGTGVDVSGVFLTNQRKWTVKDKFGGEFVFNFNNGHAFVADFQNLKCRVELTKFERFNSGINYGYYFLIEGCDYVNITNVTFNNAGKILAVPMFSFGRSKGRVAESTFMKMTSTCVSAYEYSDVFCYQITGSVDDNTTVPYSAEVFSTLNGLSALITGAKVQTNEQYYSICSVNS